MTQRRPLHALTIAAMAAMLHAACGSGDVADATDSLGGQSGSSVANTWTECAKELQVCEFTDTRAVRYGNGAAYVEKTFTGRVLCTNAAFGDPAPRSAKRC